LRVADAAELTVDAVRALLQAPLTDAEAEAVLASYATLALAVSAFPDDRLAQVEPALRSTPGPSLT
jgi:hypothetical protein